jgi:hypothetical protein
MTKFEPTRERLEELRKTMSNVEIAQLEGVSLSAVKRRVRSLEIAPRPIKERPESDAARKNRLALEQLRDIADAHQIGRVRVVAVDAGISLMDRAKQILGKRMGEDRARGYLLDGRPASSAQVVKAAGLTFGRQMKPRANRRK